MTHPKYIFRLFGDRFVSRAGHLLTNAHVVNECRSVSISQPGVSGWISAQVLSRDRNNDLALLRVSVNPMPKPPLFRRTVRLGEDVSVFGFPLTSLVASSGNFTKGSITAIAGLQDDTTKMQLAAPIQPGNSGGPVVDQTGAVVGVIVGKLNALLVAKATGSIPEQINFAIKANTVLGFLEANGVSVVEAEKGGALLNGPDLADHARQFTVLVGCLQD
jgi:S1-C subfamily serine protease